MLFTVIVPIPKCWLARLRTTKIKSNQIKLNNNYPILRYDEHFGSFSANLSNRGFRNNKPSITNQFPSPLTLRQIKVPLYLIWLASRFSISNRVLCFFFRTRADMVDVLSTHNWPDNAASPSLFITLSHLLHKRWGSTRDNFIKSILKSLVILATWLARWCDAFTNHTMLFSKSHLIPRLWDNFT